MVEINLSKYGITGTTEIVHNPSYDELFNEETKPELEGFEKGQVSELGAVNVMTGIYTGRSPKDKFIVEDETSKDTVWWTTDEYKNDNHPATKEAWRLPIRQPLVSWVTPIMVASLISLTATAQDTSRPVAARMQHRSAAGWARWEHASPTAGQRLSSRVTTLSPCFSAASTATPR